MIWLIGSLVYGAIALVTMRVLTPHFAWFYFENKEYFKRDLTSPDGEQWFGAAVTALLCAVFWPAAILWAFDFPAVGAAGRAKLRQQEQRIRELEREAGL